MGAHGVDWRNEGAASASALVEGSGVSSFQDTSRGYGSVHHGGAYGETETSNRYGSQHCSGLPEPDGNHRYYNQHQHSTRDSDIHYGQQHLVAQDNDNIFQPSYPNPNDSDGRYLAIPVSDTSNTPYTQQLTSTCDEDSRNTHINNNSSYQNDNGVTVRYRSMSSEPRSGRKDAENRRTRCSSANRVRQTRQRTAQVSSTTASATMPTPQVSSQALLSTTIAPLQTNPQAAMTTASSSSSVQVQLATSLSDRQNWDPGQQQQAAAVAHDGHSDDRGYGGLHPSVSSSTGSYGYQVEDLEALLSHSSASQPANLPMVLASPTRLHHMRRTQANCGPSRPFLPLGVIVNAVFKTRDWLYVRTAHGAEGFVPYHVCLPLGILPTKPVRPTTETTAPAAAWEMQETPLPRGRCRERRRQVGSNSANQTDLQKLHPMARVASTEQREFLPQPQPQLPTQNQPQYRSQNQAHHSQNQPSGSRN